jgi:hypothetical protein
MNKISVTQDTLYSYFLAHNIKLLRLSEMMGVNDDMVTSCFRHCSDRHGSPRRFTAKSIALINESLPRLAEELRARLLTFGTDRVYTNAHGRTYDPGLIEPLKDLGRYLNITGLTNRLLGWSQNKKSSILCRPNAANYGNITEADIIIINNEILSIAGVLSNYQVVPDNDR